MKYLVLLTIFFIISLYYTCCKKQYIQKPNISQANLLKVNFNDLEGFYNDNLQEALDVFKKDCKKAKQYKNLKNICKKALTQTNGKQFFTQNFTPYQLISKNEQEYGLITGYYESFLNGSLQKTEKYKYGIYKVPKDLITIDLAKIYPELKKYRLRGKLQGNKIIPYDSREKLSKRDDLKAICYVDDKIDLFFLHIQGSGKIKLQNGKIINIGYANQNGRHYYSIGRKLIQMGVIKKENISLQTIKQYLQNNPKIADQILNLNKSYIFFKQNKQGATGSLGVELKAFRNIAVDRRYIPFGYPVFLQTTNPLNNNSLSKLTIAADTGGAIKGEIRADLFCGFGEKAKLIAGKMKQKGKLYILIPNN